jgi:hypothetical protein
MHGVTNAFAAVPPMPTCDAEDTLAGLDRDVVSGYSTTVGIHTLVATAIDQAGNRIDATLTDTVQPWTLRGYSHPVDMRGIYNTVKNGSTVPLKFEVVADRTDLTNTSLVAMSATQITCATGTPTDEIEVLATGGTSLRYDTASGHFVYNWQTPKQAGSCYAVTARIDDGSVVTAVFKLK